MAKLDLRIALCHKNLGLELDEFTKTRLFILLREITTGRAHEENILHTSLLGSLDELHRDVEFVLVGRWDEADGVAFSLLESLDHVPDATRLVWDDRAAQLLNRLALSSSRVKRKTDNRVDLLGEVFVGEEEFGDEVASLAIGGGDADVARHVEGS